MNLGFSGSQPERWYSGRIARLAPFEAASRRWAVAVAKFASGSRG